MCHNLWQQISPGYTNRLFPLGRTDGEMAAVSVSGLVSEKTFNECRDTVSPCPCRLKKRTAPGQAVLVFALCPNAGMVSGHPDFYYPSIGVAGALG